MNNSSAYYIHDFVTNMNTHGAGKIIINEIEKLAIKDNEFLNHYCESLRYH